MSLLLFIYQIITTQCTFFFFKIKLPKVIPKLDSSLSIMQVPEVVGTVQYRAYCSMLLLSILIVLIKK